MGLHSSFMNEKNEKILTRLNDFIIQYLNNLLLNVLLFVVNFNL